MLALYGIIVVFVLLFVVFGLMFGLARLLSMFGKPENRWKRYAAVMVPTVAIITFVILILILQTVINFIMGVDPFGDYEVPLRHRYTVFLHESPPPPYTIFQMQVCDVADGKNAIVVLDVNELYMEGDVLYGRAIDDDKVFSEGFALDLRSGKRMPVKVDSGRLKPEKDFCEERESEVYTPLGWIEILLSAAIAFLAGWWYFKVIRENKV